MHSSPTADSSSQSR